MENVSKPKTYWKIMKMLIKSNKGSSNIPPLQNIIHDMDFSDVVYGDDEKCNLLNKYFCSISNLDDENVQVPEFHNRTNNILCDIHINLNEIIDVLKILDPNKASGPDLISHRMLKFCPEKVAIPLKIIFNKSIQQCKYPTSWKIANVISIFKKGDSSLPSNYRPISLISCVGKVMERVVYKNVYNHLHSNKLIYEYQSGFLPKCSTVHQLLEMYNCILDSLEKKEINCFVFCDFSKAFDKVWHRGLLHKMKSYGVDGNLLNWFTSYLYNRKQRVVINDSSSLLRNLSAGVPQGSVLGPLLFIIYINDIAKNLMSLGRLFADDTSFNYSSHDGLQIQSVIDHDLKVLDDWSKDWLMSFNPDKTEILLFSNIETPQLQFTLNGKDIPIKNCHKHLGITFSCDAKWNKHIENILTSISRHINVLRKLKFRLSRKNLEKLYIVYIRPIFEYACEVWDNCGEVNSYKLEHLQLEAARIVTGLPIFTSTSLIYKELGWEPLADRRKRRKLQMFYNIQHENAPKYLCDLIPPTLQSTTMYPLRNGDDVILPFCRLSTTYGSFIPSTIRSWNNLDTSIRNVDSISKFKNELKNKVDTCKVPYYYGTGQRKLNIILTQLRCYASFLNYDLFRVNIISSPVCSCGAHREDSYHFFFDCPNYTQIRYTLMQNLLWLPNDYAINLQLLTSGNSNLTDDQNETIFKHVYEYIKKSERFLII